MKLIKDWKKAWKLASVRFAVLGLVLSSAIEIVAHAWVMLPRSLQDKLPSSTMVAIIFLGLTIVGRILSFTRKEEDSDE